MNDNIRRYLAEFLGTYILVFAGTGAVIANDSHGNALTHVGIAIVFGLVVMTMIYAIGDLSGAHINPAVSIGFWFLKLFPGKDLVFYIIAQVSGAIAASATLKWFYPTHESLGSTLPAVTDLKAFVMEVLLSFFLMFTIVHVCQGAKEKGLMAGIAIGGMVGLEAMFGGPITGASMNPARSIGPGLLSGQGMQLWVYIAGPIVGVLLACLTCKGLRGDKCCQADGQSCD